MYSILVDRVTALHWSVFQATLMAQAMGRRLVEEPPSLEGRLDQLAEVMGVAFQRDRKYSPDELALRRALGLRG